MTERGGPEVIFLQNCSKVFNRGKPNEFIALQDVSLVVKAGRLTVFKGPSGSGKTTLLSLVGSMSRPTRGRIFVLGTETTSLPERFLTMVRRRTFGFIFQHFNLIRGISALENVMLPAYPTGEPFLKLRERARSLLRLLNVGDKADNRVELLSGGEAQRVAIARALINDPSVIIADEPTAHLDTTLSRELIDIMGQFRNEGRTVIIASHDPLVFLSGLVDDIVELRGGRIVDVAVN